MEHTEIDVLTKYVRTKLDDAEGKIFKNEKIEGALHFSVEAYNCIPPFTSYSLNDEMDCKWLSKFRNVIVLHCAHTLLSSQSLAEKGREFSTSDSGVSFTPPDLASHLSRESGIMFDQWYQLAREIKNQEYE